MELAGDSIKKIRYKVLEIQFWSVERASVIRLRKIFE